MPRYTDTSQYSAEENDLWEKILAHEHETFKTKKGLSFTYTIKGNQILISRKKKPILRSSLNLAYKKMQSVNITGPKELGVYGGSYHYGMLNKLGNEDEAENRCLFRNV